MEPIEGPKEREWRCTECDYIHVGEKAPAECPKCHALGAAFVPVEDIDFGIEPEL